LLKLIIALADGVCARFIIFWWLFTEVAALQENISQLGPPQKWVEVTLQIRLPPSDAGQRKGIVLCLPPHLDFALWANVAMKTVLSISTASGSVKEAAGLACTSAMIC
jgi:hypothetical protein